MKKSQQQMLAALLGVALLAWLIPVLKALALIGILLLVAWLIILIAKKANPPASRRGPSAPSPSRQIPLSADFPSPRRLVAVEDTVGSNQSVSSFRAISVKTKAQCEALTRYVVLDFETTGFSEDSDRIIEVSADKYNNGALAERFHSLVNPHMQISAKISSLTGLTDSELSPAPDEGAVIPALHDFLQDFIIVAHYAKFDIAFLCAAYQRNGISAAGQYLDSISVARKAFPGLPSYSLENLIMCLGLGAKQDHRADSDTLYTAKVLQLSIDKIIQREIEQARLQKNVVNLTEEQRQKDAERERWNWENRVRDRTLSPGAHPSPDCPLWKKKVAFTGAFSLSRDAMMQKAFDAGATIRRSVSSTTDYLVMGTRHERYTDTDAPSRKVTEALRIISTGEGPLKILREKEFLAMTEAREAQASTL